MNTTRPGGRPNDLSWHTKFIAAFAKAGTIKAGCAAAGIDRHTYYDHIRKFPDFAQAVQNANDEVADELEFEAYRRAVNGVPKVVGWTKDQRPLVITKYNDRLLMFLLRGRRAEVYGNKAVRTRSQQVQPQIQPADAGDHVSTFNWIADLRAQVRREIATGQKPKL